MGITILKLRDQIKIGKDLKMKKERNSGDYSVQRYNTLNRELFWGLHWLGMTVPTGIQRCLIIGYVPLEGNEWVE